MEYLLIGLVSFFYIAARAFQQLNVVFKKYIWTIPLSYLMTFSEVFIWSSVAIKAVEGDYASSAILAFALGTGAWMGAFVSMATHKKATGKGYGKKKY